MVEYPLNELADETEAILARLLPPHGYKPLLRAKALVACSLPRLSSALATREGAALDPSCDSASSRFSSCALQNLLFSLDLSN